MHRIDLLDKLRNYGASSLRDERVRDEIAAFVNEHSDCFERSLGTGHITGSAWIVNRARDRFLLTFHKKLGLWLQLGGHADGNSDILAVALQEAREESGVENISPISEAIFDLDIHRIPEHKGVAEHYHYDVRFLCEADDSQKLIVSDESHDLAWLSAEQIKGLTNEESILRMLRRSPLA
ncbi:MAG: NUDIX hydrolase [Candidatus Zixiibacteriota bacterium]